MKILSKLIAPALAVVLFGGAALPAANADTKGAPKALKGTWITKTVKISKKAQTKEAAYQKNIWYVGNQSTDESGLMYKTKTQPAKFFNNQAGGANSGLTYSKSGNTYYLNSKGGKNYFHYKAELLNNKKLKLYFSSTKHATKWKYKGEYYKQSNKQVNFTTKTAIKY